MSLVSQPLSLEITGAGLVSAMGMTPEQHVAFARADTSMATSGAFVGRDGEPLDAIYCAWIDPKADLAERLSQLALRAAASACGSDLPAANIPTILITEAAWAGLSEAHIASVSDALTAQRYRVDQVMHGAGAVAAALCRAATLLEHNDRVLALCVDSYIAPAALPHRAMRWSDWERSGAPASEGAAALCVSSGGTSSLGRVRWAGSHHAASNDDNDEPVDGDALTLLLRSAATNTLRSYGQHTVDALREQAWSFAASRCHELLGADHLPSCIEERAGRLGAAAGLAHLVFGLHDAPTATLFASWSISRDGTRSLCVAEVTS